MGLFDNALEKFVAGTFSCIETISLQEEFRTKSQIETLNELKAEMRIVDGRVHCCFHAISPVWMEKWEQLLRDERTIHLIHGEISYEFTMKSFSSTKRNVYNNEWDFTVKEFKRTSDPQMNSFRRLVLVAGRKVETSSYVDAVPLSVGSMSTMNGIIHVSVLGKSFSVFPVSLSEIGPHYLFVDSNSPITEPEFLRFTKAIRTSFAFITGHYYANVEYSFSSENATFQELAFDSYKYQESSLHSALSPIPNSTHQIHFQVHPFR